MQNNNVANEQNSPDYLDIQSAESIGLRFEVAGIGARSHAFVIDWHIRFLVALVWLFVCGMLLFSFDGLLAGEWENVSDKVVYVWLLPAGILYFFYHPVLEVVLAGKTPGKKMAGVKIVTTEGLTPRTGALLIRNVFRLLDSLPSFYLVGIITAAFTQHHVRVGDLAANLVLVYDNDVGEKELEQVSRLTLHSNLSTSNQMLLLDIVNRWEQLFIDDRIQISEQFLAKVGELVPESSGNKKIHDKYLLAQLKRLAGDK